MQLALMITRKDNRKKWEVSQPKLPRTPLLDIIKRSNCLAENGMESELGPIASPFSAVA